MEPLEMVALLQEQIKTLKELIAAKDELIQQLKTKINYNPVSIPLTTTTPYSQCQHEYSNNWNSTVPPSCIKCGAQYYQPLTVTVTNSTPNEMTQELIKKLNDHDNHVNKVPGLMR